MLRNGSNARAVAREAPQLWRRVFAFLLGLSVSMGAIYAFKIGNTSVYVGYCLGLVICTCCILFCSRRLIGLCQMIDVSIFVFVAVACLSVVPSLLWCIFNKLPDEALGDVFKGLIILVVGVFVYLSSIMLVDCRRQMVLGVAIGVSANVIFTIVAQVSFNMGDVFSLANAFPQDAFIVSAKWGAAVPYGAYPIYSFRAQGLFLEASHLMVFLVAWGWVSIAALRSSLAVKVIFLVGILYLGFQSFSPNVLFLFLELFLIAALLKNVSASIKYRRIHRSVVLVGLLIVFVVCLAVIIYREMVVNLLYSLLNSLGDINPFQSSDSGTLDRFSSMRQTLEAIPQFPFGTGWNTESVVLSTLFGQGAVASHSFALRLLLETGLIGLSAYAWIVVRHAKCALAGGKFGVVVFAAVVFTAVAQFLNGATMLPHIWLLLGLAKGLSIESANEIPVDENVIELEN